MPHLWKPLIVWIFLCVIILLPGRNASAAGIVDTLFQSERIIEMELRSDFSAIQEDRAEEPENHDGELIYLTNKSDTVRLSVLVMARGNFRRDPLNCSFPPIMVNFKKKEVENTLFDNQNKLKLVTPCQTEEDVLEEYLIYKMYNLVTDISHRVRLVKMFYFDTGRNKRLFERYSFFIEDEDHVAERNDCFEKDKFITPFDMDQDNVKKMSVFQYMIGNKDWYITSRHNIKILQPLDTTKVPYALPYDFDFSAFINADYTKPKGVPDEMLENRRVYKGLCYSREEFYEIFEFYRGLRPQFDALIMQMDGISKYSRKLAVRYIGYFYNVIEDDALIEKEFYGTCNTRKDYFKFE
ncbi:MAG: hypothetical protein KFF73_00035 [Cyclobacteriaceae bacterium]|nr:hypothetical protein [Cyclobacteriaceae bacterium]